MVITKNEEIIFIIKRNALSILEFEYEKNAKINQTHLIERGFEFNKLVITFFPEVINKLFNTILN